MKLIQAMLKKDALFKRDKRGKDMFPCINSTISQELALYNIDFKKYFMLYSFTSYTSLIIVITQNDGQNIE